MRKYITLLLGLIVCLSANAQHDVTKFLGIPVDGFKPDMIKKLEAKGFVYNKETDLLSGEFNGYDVLVSVVTNNNKVYRIMLVDKTYVSESTIISRFNKLCEQFGKNKRYVSFAVSYDSYEINEYERIGVEMTVRNKRYEASFYQITESVDSAAIEADLNELIKKRFTQEQIENPTEEIKKEMLMVSFDYAYGYMHNKCVWFYIDRDINRYGIVMYYDNEWNRANGEDL